jgi:2-iminoacetate synthase
MLVRPNSEGLVDFIPAAHIDELLRRTAADAVELREVLAKSMNKERLSLEEMAALLSVTSPELLEEMFAAARQLKQVVYGNRIVLFAPLYIGNKCINSCKYCGFRCGNQQVVRRTLTDDELRAEVAVLLSRGHKRLVIDYGEHPDYDADVIAHAIEVIYSVKTEHGEIRRINVNCAPLDVEGYRKMKAVGIGTYQIFQETYHRPTYRAMHPTGNKADFLWRLYGQDRAMEGGCDDVGLGALFGLYDWRFEALGLLAHAIHLEERFHVGPHTFSFPRIKDASNRALDPRYAVSDAEFKRLIAILRLSVPYTGMVLTAREPAALRRELIEFGCSQIDGGTRIEIGGYQASDREQDLDKEQFRIGDTRSLDEVVDGLLDMGAIPSFCTACYRKGRTGEHFMEFAIPGFIKRFCTPNALLTFKEYLVDSASPQVKAKGNRLLAEELAKLPEDETKRQLTSRLAAMETGRRDLLF